MVKTSTNYNHNHVEAESQANQSNLICIVNLADLCWLVPFMPTWIHIIERVMQVDQRTTRTQPVYSWLIRVNMVTARHVYELGLFGLCSPLYMQNETGGIVKRPLGIMISSKPSSSISSSSWYPHRVKILHPKSQPNQAQIGQALFTMLKINLSVRYKFLSFPKKYGAICSPHKPSDSPLHLSSMFFFQCVCARV